MSKSVCFITKNYPPAIGGMENYCRDLVTYLGKSWVEVNLISNGKWKKHLPFFWVKALFQWLRYGWKSDMLWIGDGSISFIGCFISFVTRKPWFVTVHALDITRNKKLYQATIPWFVKQATGIVAVSSYTKEECIKRWIPEEKITVIPNGIDPERMPHVTTWKSELLQSYEIDASGKKVLFSIGRHIERKGIHWFLEEVMPELWDEYVYVIAGSWPYTDVYKEIIVRKWLENVYCIGRISDEDKYAFYEQSDCFVMPNIKVEWDAEWFWIVCIEAGWYGLPVIARGIEGITDAVIQWESWIILFDHTPKNWINALKNTIPVVWVKEKFSWKRIIMSYKKILT